MYVFTTETHIYNKSMKVVMILIIKCEVALFINNCNQVKLKKQNCTTCNSTLGKNHMLANVFINACPLKSNFLKTPLLEKYRLLSSYYKKQSHYIRVVKIKLYTGINIKVNAFIVNVQFIIILRFVLLIFKLYKRAMRKLSHHNLSEKRNPFSNNM